LKTSSDIFSSVKSFITNPLDAVLVTPDKRSSILDLGKQLSKIDDALKTKYSISSLLPVVSIVKGLISSPQSLLEGNIFTSLQTQGKAVSFTTSSIPVGNAEVFDMLKKDSVLNDFGICHLDTSTDTITLTSPDSSKNDYNNIFVTSSDVNKDLLSFSSTVGKKFGIGV
jgi:hypothetical protein